MDRIHGETWSHAKHRSDELQADARLVEIFNQCPFINLSYLSPKSTMSIIIIKLALLFGIIRSTKREISKLVAYSDHMLYVSKELTNKEMSYKTKTLVTSALLHREILLTDKERRPYSIISLLNRFKRYLLA